MNFSELQSDLRHFAAERDWQPFHTPKNLSTALMVEAAELAEIFQWMTPEVSQGAHLDAGLKQRIGEEVADVLLYLLQVADHSQIDMAQAVQDKLARNALKYPPTRSVARVSPAHAATPGTHVLLDYENVQPTENELRAMVPEASQVWVFHGPHQRKVAQRFSSFGANVTAVPISKTGKNALDFHLSFYMGYIASRNQASAMVAGAAGSANAIAAALGLDMADWWEPNAEGYLNHVPKAQIIDALKKAGPNLDGGGVEAMKKDALVAAAAKRLAGTRWLPEPLRRSPG